VLIFSNKDEDRQKFRMKPFALANTDNWFRDA